VVLSWHTPARRPPWQYPLLYMVILTMSIGGSMPRLKFFRKKTEKPTSSPKSEKKISGKILRIV